MCSCFPLLPPRCLSASNSFPPPCPSSLLAYVFQIFSLKASIRPTTERCTAHTHAHVAITRSGIKAASLPRQSRPHARRGRTAIVCVVSALQERKLPSHVTRRPALLQTTVMQQEEPKSCVLHLLLNVVTPPTKPATICYYFHIT